MGDVIKFVRPSATALKQARKETAKGRTLCSRGFHRWVIDARKQFDVEQGRLVTLHRCTRCAATKTSLT